MFLPSVPVSQDKDANSLSTQAVYRIVVCWNVGAGKTSVRRLDLLDSGNLCRVTRITAPCQEINDSRIPVSTVLTRLLLGSLKELKIVQF